MLKAACIPRIYILMSLDICIHRDTITTTKVLNLAITSKNFLVFFSFFGVFLLFVLFC